MGLSSKRKSIDSWRGLTIAPGESADVFLPVSESYTGISLKIPIRIIRGVEDGPVVFITAALHGDELNGTGAVRQLLADPHMQLLRGSLILVPILNLLAFDRHSRYLPDRRDLNRFFPGSASGSLAGRIARQIFVEIVGRSDFGIDLHTAAVRRTNYPNVRADMSDPAVRQLALDFGAELIVNFAGAAGTLRREATAAGCPTIVLEGGEVWKVEPAIVETAVRGIKSVLQARQMIKGDRPTSNGDRPISEGDRQTSHAQVILEQTKWVRADRGGFLQFHVRPGQVVQQDQPIATNADLLGREQSVLVSPFDGVIIGMTTLPAISPGEPVCHIGRLPQDTDIQELRRARKEPAGLEHRTVKELASNVLVTPRPPET